MNDKIYDEHTFNAVFFWLYQPPKKIKELVNVVVSSRKRIVKIGDFPQKTSQIFFETIKKTYIIYINIFTVIKSFAL